MLEILQFIFSSFWIWSGFTITIIGAFGALRGDTFIKTYIKKVTKTDDLDKQ